MARARLRRLLGPKLPIPGRLHVCPACRGDFVNPTQWTVSADGVRGVCIRCGACGHEGEMFIDPTAAALLQAAHASRLDDISRAAAGLEQERMAGWVESFAIALERDLIDASDF